MTVRRAAGLLLTIAIAVSSAQEGKTRNVIFVMTDGLRWQDTFHGADPALLVKKNGGVADAKNIKAEFWRDDEKQRRESLLPFLWTVVARDGQVYGNRGLSSDVYVTNGLNFSYPGYSEALCGFPDSRIHSNEKFPNPNVNVLEWLNGKPEYAGK